MKHPFKQTFFLISLFVISQIVGLLIVNSYIDVEKSVPGKIEYKEIPGIERPELEKQTSFIYILIAVFIGTLLFIFTARFNLLWRIWYLIAVSISLSIALVPIFKSGLAFIIGFLLGIWKVFRRNVFVHNLTEVFIYGGLAALFVPILNIFSVSILLLIISVYDIIAVNYTKHMISMAKTMSVQNIFPGFKLDYGAKNIEIKEVKSEKINFDKKPITKNIAILGGGDVAFPLFFAGVVMGDYGIAKAGIVVLFSTLGLLSLFYLSKKGKFYPAMPPIAIGCFIAFGLIKLIS